MSICKKYSSWSSIVGQKLSGVVLLNRKDEHVRKINVEGMFAARETIGYKYERIHLKNPKAKFGSKYFPIACKALQLELRSSPIEPITNGLEAISKDKAIVDLAKANFTHLNGVPFHGLFGHNIFNWPIWALKCKYTYDISKKLGINSRLHTSVPHNVDPVFYFKNKYKSNEGSNIDMVALIQKYRKVIKNNKVSRAKCTAEKEERTAIQNIIYGGLLD